MIYLIDHEDSFTFNLAHLLGEFDKIIVSNYYEIDKLKLSQADTIVLSPGPGEPKNYPTTRRIYNVSKEGSIELNFLAIIAVIFSFIISYITIALFLNFIKKFSLKIFIIYRIILSLFLLTIVYL